MASIDKLQIRGIRAFSPHRDETIEFYSPLTMIVGANGCGKTTVIECLKMACTGALPPSVAQGQSFVNDPSMTNSSEVKAHIKLRFNNKSGQPTVVARLYQVIRKKTKLEFKRLDGTVRTTDAAGVKQSITQKCSDLDKHVPELLGVTSAVMENVVFCHQEESCWPLQDSSVLKKKFDDIFDSARYTKALDAIKQSKKEYKSKSNDLKVEVASLGAHLEAANVLREDLGNSEEKEEICTTEMTHIGEELTTINESLNEYHSMIHNVEDMEEELKQLQWKSEENIRRVSEKRDNLEQEFSDNTEEELRNQLSGFEDGMKDKVAELEKLKDEMRSLHRCISEDRNNLSIMSARRGEAFTLQQQSGAQANKLINLMKDIATSSACSTLSSPSSASESSSFNLLGPDFYQLEAGNLGDNGPEAVLAESFKFLNALQSSMEEKKRESMKKSATAQEAVDVAYSTHLESSRAFQKLNLELNSAEEDLRKVDRERAQISENMKSTTNSGRSGSMAQQKAQAKRELELCKNEYDDFFRTLSRKTKNISDEKQSGDERLRELAGIIEQNNTILEKLSLNRAESERFEAQRNQIEADEESCKIDVGNTISKYQSHICSITPTGAVPDIENHMQLEDLWTSLQRNLTDTKSSAVSTREEYSRVKEEAARARAIYDQDTRKVKELERIIVKKYGDCEMNLRKCMEALGKLMSDEDGEDVVDVDDSLKQAFDKLIVGDNCYQALSDHQRDMSGSLTVASSGISQSLTGKSSSNVESTQSTKLNPEEVISEVLRILSNEFTENSMAFKSAKVWKEKLVKKSKKRSKGRNGGPKCPCCDRPMNEEEMNVFQQNLSSIFEKADNAAMEELSKQKATEAQVIIKQFSSECQNVKGLISCRHELEMVNNRIAEFQDGLETQLTQKERNYKKKVDSAEESIKVNEKCIFELGSLLNTWTNIVSRAEELNTKQQRHKKYLPQSHSGGGDARSIREIEEEQKRLLEEKESLQKSKERLLEEENRLSRQQHILKDNLSSKEATMNDLTKKEDVIKDFEAKLAKLQASEQECDKQIQSKKRSKINVERKMKVHEEEERAARLNLKSIEERSRADLQIIENHISSIEQLQKSLRDIQRQCDSADLTNVDTRLAEINEKIKVQENRIQELTPVIESLTGQVTQQEHTKRIVLDNISLREAERERDQTLEELSKMEETVNGHTNGKGKIRDIKRNIQRLEQQKSKMEKQYNHLEGQLSAHKDQIHEIHGKLKSGLYKKIDERYRVKNIEYETTVMAVSDLDSYNVALDNALQRFHTLRIADINKIIKEMWQLIYRGEDIDMIEIVSGAEDSTGGNRASRSYNYRVVMRKGDVPLDMRGRCSAGQRVMASVVIRLALAETLCLDCGMLCLDEPTTNLDDANKTGLAYALSRIIASRSSQQNFQLICITHDEEFVRMISEQLATVADFRLPEYYFRISRQQDEGEGEAVENSKYFSHIEKIPWDDMM